MNLEETQTIKFYCSSCNQPLRIEAEAAGEEIECPACGTSLLIPGTTRRVVIEPDSPPVIKRSRSASATATPPPQPRPAPSRKPLKKKKSKSILLLPPSLGCCALLGGAGYWLLNERGGGAAKESGEVQEVSEPSWRPDNQQHRNVPAAPTAVPVSNWAVQNSGNSQPEESATFESIAAVEAPRSKEMISTTVAAAAPPEIQAGNAASQVAHYQFGSTGKHRDEVSDMAVRPDGRIVMVGTLSATDGIPQAGKVHRLGDSRDGGKYGFVAELAADGSVCNWFGLFGGDVIEPTCVALSPDGSIALGGKVAGRTAEVAGPDAGNFKGLQSVIAKVRADGSAVEWILAGASNQGAVSDIAVDNKGRVVYIAPARVRGSGAYVMRKNADGSPSTFPGQPEGRDWAIDFDVRGGLFTEPGQIGEFYARGVGNNGYDYDGPGKWAPIMFKIMGMRQNGRLVLMPNNDIVVCGTLQYDFKEQGKKWFPAFDTITARFREDGSLIWSSNLYQPGDSVHTPDQKDADMIYNPANGDLYFLIKQHGSNVYRFKGDLRGDTGNMMIGWVGRVNAETGEVKAGWYWQNSRNTGYDANGLPSSPPHPKLAGNDPKSLGVDREGNIYMAGNAGAKAFTTSNAWKPWPQDIDGGSTGALTILSPDLKKVLYASMIGADHNDSFAKTMVLNAHGVWLGGHNKSPDLQTESVPWSSELKAGAGDAALYRFKF